MGEPEEVDRPATSSPARGLRPHLGPLLILNLFALLLSGWFLNGALGEWGGDNVEFLLLAEALSEGEGYVDLYLPGQPPHLNYPPVYPLLLTPFVFSGAPLLVLKGFTAALGLAGLNVGYFLLLRWHDRKTALLVLLSTLACGTFLDSGLSIMSESPYLLFSAATLLLVQRTFDSEGRRPWLWITSGAMMGLSVLTRLVGVVLGPATLLLAALGPPGHRRGRERIRRLAVVGAVAAAIAGPWFLRGTISEARPTRNYFREFVDNSTIRSRIQAEAEKNRLAASEHRETGEVGPPERSRVLELAMRPLDNLWYLGTRLGRTPMPEFVRALGPSWSTLFLVAFLALCIALAGLAFLGWLRGLLLRRGAHDFYVASYVLLLLVWVGGGFRLIMPILVFLFAYVHEGAVFLARSSARAHGFGRSILVVSILANLLVTFEFPLIRDRLAGRYEPWWGDLLTATCKLGSVARAGETVIASPENVAFYFAGLQAGRLPERPTPEALLEAILLSNADYLVTTPVQRTRYGEKIFIAVRKYPGFFRRVLREGEISVYRILRDPGDEIDPSRDPGTKPASPSARCVEILR